MKNWIRKINQKDFLANWEIEELYFPNLVSKDLLLNNEKIKVNDTFLIETLENEVKFYIFDDQEQQENFLIKTDTKDIFIRSFFYKTLTQKVKEELTTFLFFNHLVNHANFDDLLIDVNGFLPDFLKNRKKILNSHEFNHLYQKNLKNYLIPILGLVFVSLLHYKDFKQKLNLLEKKNLKEIFFTNKLKKLLCLEKDSFEYIHKKTDINKSPFELQKKFSKIKKLIDEKKISLMDYIQDNLVDKKILFWGIWTISPYLALDISLFINLLNQSKKIKRIYIDLPLSSEKKLKKLFLIKDFSLIEDKVETEIKKLYPDFIEDYAKETLPYLTLLEKVKLFELPFFINGFPGSDVPFKIPRIEEEKLVFDNEKIWQESISLEYKNIDQLFENELVIFFFFLKPMHFLPFFIKDHPHITKLLHGDPFLGYGPKKPENSIAIYSQFSNDQSYSFVLKNIDSFFFKDEPINYYPQSEFLPYPIKNSHFNEFKVFNAFLYSNFKGGGGFNFEGFPHQPIKDRILS